MKNQHHNNALGAFVLLVAMSFLSGCATTGTTESDPLERPNRTFFNINESLDKHFMKPVARGYKKITPKPVRVGVTNFFGNLYYPNTILNGLLQGKFRQSGQDLGRFVLNSTLGFGGLLDPASAAGLKQHDEDLGQTLATWGVGRGSYLVLPLRGPDTVRNVSNIGTSSLLNPFFYAATVIAFPVGLLDMVNRRANLLEETEIRDEAALDAYAFTREAYLQHRQHMVYDGNPPPSYYELSIATDDE